VLIAGLLLDLASLVCALLATVLGRHCNGEGALRDAEGSTVAAICALLAAGAPLTPGSFTIDRAWVRVAILVLNMLNMLALTTSELRFHANDVLSRLTACATVGAAVAPLSEVTDAIDWARDVTAHLGLFVPMLMRTCFTAMLGVLGNVVSLGHGASAAEVLSGTSTCDSCIAHVVLAPLTLTSNWAWRLVAEGFWKLTRRRNIPALLAAMHCWRNLNPLTRLDDGGLDNGVETLSRALSEFRPGAHGINRARNWLRIAGSNLNLIQLTALHATMLSLYSDDPMARLCAVSTTSICALIPL